MEKTHEFIVMNNELYNYRQNYRRSLPIKLEDLRIGEKFLYGAMPEGEHVTAVDQYRFTSVNRCRSFYEGEPYEYGNFFSIPKHHSPYGGYGAISEIQSITASTVKIDGKELPHYAITLSLHGRAKYEIKTEITENSLRIEKIYQPLE